MRIERRGSSYIDDAAFTRHALQHARIACSFPITIKGFNVIGTRYDELALVENISHRGLCCRTSQYLIPGNVFTVYQSEDELDPVAIFEVVWTNQCEEKIRRLGAQITGDNYSWLKYLSMDVVLLKEAVITRVTKNISH